MAMSGRKIAKSRRNSNYFDHQSTTCASTFQYSGREKAMTASPLSSLKNMKKHDGLSKNTDRNCMQASIASGSQNFVSASPQISPRSLFRNNFNAHRPQFKERMLSVDVIGAGEGR